MKQFRKRQNRVVISLPSHKIFCIICPEVCLPCGSEELTINIPSSIGP